MRISLNWLKELVDVNVAPDELAETLTMAGFEVEDIEDRRTWADGVVIGKVLSCEPHPNADKLRVCQVELGTATPANIVCGAANVRADIFVAVATPGTYLPKIDLKIRPTKLRGVPSEGMICSLAELGLMKESAGIHIFESEALKPGTDARPLLGLDDVILDVTSTANRADALSMVGIAREVAALTGGTLRLPEPVLAQQTLPRDATALGLKVSEPQSCPSYIGTVITGVRTEPSPEWLQRRLQAAGMRPINNIVDVTNYILLEWGQPLHAFDLDRLNEVTGSQSLTVGVRFAQAGESLKTLDGQLRNLQEQNLLITANDRPVALAGVMGGEATEVHEATQNLMLEAAVFEPIAIRRSARCQTLRTEASARYERGVNQAELVVACQRALQLITELAGGTILTQESALVHADPTNWVRSIELRLERVNQVLGPIELENDETGELQPQTIERILTTLGCTVTPTDQEQVWKVTVPPYRYRDLEREIDLIEEVARLYGYNQFCDTLPSKTEPGYLSLEEELTRKLRATLRAEGLTELLHYSLVKTEGDRQIALSNPLFTEYSALRTKLLPALLDAFQYNLEQGNGPLNGFEIGRVFWSEEDGLAEADSVAGILGGDPKQGKWPQGGRDQPMTWYEAKGLLESVFQQLGLTVEYQPDRRDPMFHPGRTASLWVQGNRLGTFGQLHPQVRQERGLPDSVYAFELSLDVILDFMDRDEILTPVFKPYSTFPASDRDLAFFAATDVSVAELQRQMAKAGGQLLESVEVFDEYRGENVPAGQRSLAFRLTYRASDRTLTDGEVEPVHQKIREALAEKFRVELRS